MGNNENMDNTSLMLKTIKDVDDNSTALIIPRVCKRTTN